jgi:DNA-binding NarL/FixJ family response regulator
MVSVLIVDDDDGFRRLAARVLAASGFDVVGEAGTCAAAMSAARTNRPATALVDVNLPDGDGIGLSRVLAALPWAPRIVLISGDADAGRAARVARAGAVGFLTKDELADGRLVELLGDQRDLDA